ncbi:hypothetical protein PR048_017667 [Dryococelus australis]|uniref:DUF4817 domain-containing protein n=1 Tax=Dryococelus australis TaxID=614101 RepID=A0ABQ9HA86_9NEOP|nr:hypothetical protein PR048_017667 [Dryococelus australis]
MGYLNAGSWRCVGVAITAGSDVSCQSPLEASPACVISRDAELAGVHLTYGAANENGRAAQRLHGERFPSRRLPSRQTFERACTGSFAKVDPCVSSRRDV